VENYRKREVEVAKDEDEDKVANIDRQQLPVDRPVDRCAPTCTGNTGRPPGRPQKKNGRPPGRPTDKALLSGWSGRPGLGSVDRPVDRQTDPSRFRISVLNWKRVQLRFPIILGLLVINKRAESSSNVCMIL